MGSVPVGYRFEPTDEELVGFYLYNKVCGNPLSCNGVIMECDLYGDKEPWEIWEAFGGTDQLYLFTRLKKTSPKSSRFKRTVGKGCWKGDMSGNHAKEVFHSRTNQRIGSVNSYHYKRKGKESYEYEDNHRWNMTEFCLNASLLPQSNFNDYVLCRITKKTLNTNTEEHVDYEFIANDHHHIAENQDPEIDAYPDSYQQIHENSMAEIDAYPDSYQQIHENSMAEINAYPEFHQQIHENSVAEINAYPEFHQQIHENSITEMYAYPEFYQQIHENSMTEIYVYPLSQLPANDQQIADCYSPKQRIEGDGIGMELACYFETLEPVFNIDDFLVDFEPNCGYMTVDGGGDMLDLLTSRQ